MRIRIHGHKDAVLQCIHDALKAYVVDHPAAEVDVYRRGAFAVCIRVVDPFLGRYSRVRRHAVVWKYLETLPEEKLFHVSLLLLLTAGETADSVGNIEFERDLKSRKTRSSKKGRVKASV